MLAVGWRCTPCSRGRHFVARVFFSCLRFCGCRPQLFAVAAPRLASLRSPRALLRDACRRWLPDTRDDAGEVPIYHWDENQVPWRTEGRDVFPDLTGHL